jgi:intracellular sulfur oxidation DsrE/DsrF family protein
VTAVVCARKGFFALRGIGLVMIVAMLALASIVILVPAAAETAAEDHPFADQHLALQLSDSDGKKQSLVISVAYNLLTFYGPDRIAIEVVTFGPGIDLLRADNPNRKLVDSLIAQGVRFDVCMNTVDTIERDTGKRPELNPKAMPVEAGVAQILTLAKKGYTLVRP